MVVAAYQRDNFQVHRQPWIAQMVEPANALLASFALEESVRVESCAAASLRSLFKACRP
jgi:hypothetical protein